MITKTTFLKGIMNKSVDERLLPQGEYIDALNVRAGSTEDTEIGAIENTKGNELLVSLQYNGEPLLNAKCIGAYEDGARETIYWFVTSSNVDMIVSYNTNTQTTIEHVVSVSVLNFSEKHLINSIDMVEDLLFFTDNHNPPRKININPGLTVGEGRRYLTPDPSTGLDRLEEDDISVIVKPPLSPPTVLTSRISERGNYLEDKFITFAYRWRYLDGEYSALSPFSDAAFLPNSFGISVVDYVNIGMTNSNNVANVGFNTGDKRVKEVQLCFKRSDSNNVYVIDNFKKEDLGDTPTYTTLFDNSKIYTLLPTEELFRLYDNVPRFAQAQTIMGNRLMYGNYVDGYNMEITEGGQGLSIDYKVERESNEVFDFGIEDETFNAVYNIDPANPLYFAQDSGVRFDFTNYFDVDERQLLKGSIVSIDFVISHQSYTTTGTAPTDFQSPISIGVSFELSRDYDGIGDLIYSEDMAGAIGTDTSIKPIADAENGSTLTDQFNSSLSTSALPSGYSLEGTGVDAIGEAFSSNMYATNTSAIVVNAAKYTHATDPDIYEYFTISDTSMFIRNPGGFETLHSNRNYAVGIVYNDEYGRQSTIFTDENNSVFVDSEYMTQQNKIKATINSPAPYWATNYRMAIKPTYGGYETIYSLIVFEKQGFVYFLLDGENSRKVEEGTTLIVKSDSAGATKRFVETLVLEVKAQEKNFLIPNDTGSDVLQPAGIYMKIRATNFSVDSDEELVSFSSQNYAGGSYEQRRNCGMNRNRTGSGVYRGVGVSRLSEESESGASLPYTPVNIPVGSQVRVFCKFRTLGCEAILDKIYIAERDWDDFHAMYQGQNLNINEDFEYIDEAAPAGCFTIIDSNSLSTYDSTSPGACGNGTDVYIPLGANPATCQAAIDFAKDSGTGELFIRAFSPSSFCFSGDLYQQTIAFIGVQIVKSSGIYIFETKPLEIDNDIYYLSNEVLSIDSNGNHSGTTQNQTASQPAISTLGFFDSYCFGNGVESFKIEDRLAGDPVLIGQQTSAVSEQDYKKAHRFASITYSGVFNAETNLNKLNQFNLALANYKDLEQSFGQIGILHARETDLLTLQEDKVSYVLQGKNLLSDSVGGGSIASVPEVLGTQIARPDENGISLDPSSFAHYDNNVFFTDAKRGEVLMLKGGNYKNDQLAKISELGMRSYFRDTFISGFHTLKLGAYDPYMDEYVLSFNEGAAAPGGEIVYDVACDSELSRTGLITSDVYEVTFEPVIGTVDIDYSIDAGQQAVMTVQWDGSTVINSIISGTGIKSFTKTKTYPNTATVTMSCEGGAVEPCNTGMDVVFLIDYTSSMGSQIETVKDQISNIVDTIVTESEDNYRLGLVIFDENNGTFRYESNPAYTSLPAQQRYIQETNLPLRQGITALEVMSTNNANSFKRKVNEMNSGPTLTAPLTGTATDTIVNKLVDSTATFILDNITTGDVIYNTTDATSATVVSVDSETEVTLDADIFVSGESWSYGLQIGTGVGVPEPSDIGFSRIVEHDIAGIFRNNVNKMVIIYTDNLPGGDSDTYEEADADEMRRIASISNLNGIAVSVIGTVTGDTFNAYQDTADITGGVRTNNFDSTAIQQAIENICEE